MIIAYCLIALFIAWILKVDDLLFYYLELTLHRNYFKTEPNYKKYVDHAISIDGDRYCQFFSSNTTGGISFQLLDNKELMKIHCAHCEVKNVK